MLEAVPRPFWGATPEFDPGTTKGSEKSPQPEAAGALLESRGRGDESLYQSSCDENLESYSYYEMGF
uniref:Uncharacterized protein n=1 Tax=Sphaerodactylus townsendi TaxID=933632 RepID=A0ACB8EAU3_9SAUR